MKSVIFFHLLFFVGAIRIPQNLLSLPMPNHPTVLMRVVIPPSIVRSQYKMYHFYSINTTVPCVLDDHLRLETRVGHIREWYFRRGKKDTITIFFSFLENTIGNDA